jgi:beta-glucanase (GH16 family)
MAAYASCGNLTGYTPFWKDEFNDGKLNGSYWSPRTDNNPWHYSSSMVSEYNGNLILKANRVDGVVKYGAVISKEKFNFKYGYINVRAKIIKGGGFLSGFWLTGPNWDYRHEELDIMEQLGKEPRRLDMTRHCSTAFDSNCNGVTVDGAWKQSYKVIYPDTIWAYAYHDYALEWTPSYARWLIDGRERFRVTSGIPKDPMWITLSLCGDNCADGWSGPIDNSLLPGQIYIDSVRVCKK